jgi:hypothetical protein
MAQEISQKLTFVGSDNGNFLPFVEHRHARGRICACYKTHPRICAAVVSRLALTCDIVWAFRGAFAKNTRKHQNDFYEQNLGK